MTTSRWWSSHGTPKRLPDRGVGSKAGPHTLLPTPRPGRVTPAPRGDHHPKPAAKGKQRTTVLTNQPSQRCACPSRAPPVPILTATRGQQRSFQSSVAGYRKISILAGQDHGPTPIFQAGYADSTPQPIRPFLLFGGPPARLICVAVTSGCVIGSPIWRCGPTSGANPPLVEGEPAKA